MRSGRPKLAESGQAGPGPRWAGQLPFAWTKCLQPLPVRSRPVRNSVNVRFEYELPFEPPASGRSASTPICFVGSLAWKRHQNGSSYLRG